MPTSRRPERLVVDANPILSALLGGRARRVFFDAGIAEFAVPDAVLQEVRDHLPQVAQQVGGERAFLEYALELLPLTRYLAGTYRRMIGEARRRVGQRDPDDVDVLALALQLGMPVWTNNRDFEGTGIEYFTTARLLALFFGPSG